MDGGKRLGIKLDNALWLKPKKIATKATSTKTIFENDELVINSSRHERKHPAKINMSVRSMPHFLIR